MDIYCNANKLLSVVVDGLLWSVEEYPDGETSCYQYGVVEVYLDSIGGFYYMHD